MCVCGHDCAMYHNGYEQDVECSVGNEEGDESGNRFAGHTKLQLQVLQHQGVEGLGGMAVHCLWEEGGKRTRGYMWSGVHPILC